MKEFNLDRLHTELYEMQDEKYRLFQHSLMPGVELETVIGIRIPLLRRFANDFCKREEATLFMEMLPHKYYEENNLHGFLIEKIKDFDKAILELDRFLPYVNNWATCDMTNPKVLGKFPQKTAQKALEWISSEHIYVKRFGILTLMRYFLDERFDEKYLEIVASVRSEEYYVNMMKAWFFATALTKNYGRTLPFIENFKLDQWSHNKAITKARESLLIPLERKEELKKYIQKKKPVI